MKTIIVTRHPGALAWIQKHHPELMGEPDYCPVDHEATEHCDLCHGKGTVQSTRVVSHAEPEDLAGNRVIGVLPVDLAALCGEYWALDMRIPADFRGKELSCEDMERFGCSIKRWVVVDPLSKKAEKLQNLVEFLESFPDMAEELEALREWR